MNKIVKVILISTAMSLSTLSSVVYSHEKSESMANSMMDEMTMGQQQMMKMRGQMQDNQSLMEQIRAEGNAEKRTQLMQQHMKSMNKQMETMNSMMGDDRSSMSSVEMPEHMQMMKIMNTRMNMMQMMMNQMMEYQGQD